MTLYDGWVLEHGQDPHNEGELTGATHHARCDNPLCGDRVTVYLRVEGDTISNATFKARSCAVATASASLLTTIVEGIAVEEAQRLATAARAAVDPKQPDPQPPLEHLARVRTVRSRRRCATLAWEALQAALAPGEDP